MRCFAVGHSNSQTCWKENWKDCHYVCSRNEHGSFIRWNWKYLSHH